jgi:hypothetical protein
MNPVTKKGVGRGNYGFTAPTNTAFVEVTPHQGDRSVLDTLASRCSRAAPPDPHTIVLVLDADHEDYIEGIRRRTEGVEQRLLAHDAERIGDGPWRLSSGLEIELCVWGTRDDVQGVAIPSTHCLERLVASALAEAYPARSEAVWRWLDGRPEASGAPPKAISWSYMAGWYSDQGCDAFLRHGLWEDPLVAPSLDRLVAATGAGRIIDRLEVETADG